MGLLIQLLERLTPYGSLSYAIMFAILIFCGFGLPLPEDIILITGGVLAGRDITDFWLTVVVCMGGVLLGDGVVFMIGRKIGPRLTQTKFFRRWVGPRREEKVQQWFDQHGDKVIFFARFAPGLRMPVYLMAGTYRVSPWKFLAYDGIAALASVPLWIWVGHFFGENLEVLERKMRQVQFGIYGVLALVAVGVLVFWLGKRKVDKRFGF